MFFASLHSTVASGPRHWGQNISASLDCGAAVANAQRQAKRTVRIGGSYGRETPKMKNPSYCLTSFWSPIVKLASCWSANWIVIGSAIENLSSGPSYFLTTSSASVP